MPHRRLLPINFVDDAGHETPDDEFLAGGQQPFPVWTNLFPAMDRPLFGYGQDAVVVWTGITNAAISFSHGGISALHGSIYFV